jgi:hypothetical protein
VQGGGGPGWVEVVVVEDVLVVDVVGASVVEVDVGVAIVVVVVVVVVVVLREQPAANTTRPRIITIRLTIADLERRMSLLAIETAGRGSNSRRPVRTDIQV